MTNPISPRSIIKELLEKNGRNDDTAAKNARGIDSILTSFTRGGCFVNEFLQNANDQVPDNGSIEVSFTLMGSELIIYHNGRPFNEEDVRRICDFSNAEHNQKSEKTEQTGYKDIGFKSVFKVAFAVYIFSNEWTFHFNERIKKWERDPKENPYPWQIAPLWTGDVTCLSKTAQNILEKQGRTSFVCRLRESEVPEVQRELLRLRSNPENILFLYKTRRVTVSVEGQCFSIENREDALLLDQTIASQWQRFSISIPIPKKVKDFLVGLKSFECPKRLQKPDFTHAPLSFCYPRNANEFIQNHGIRFFCGLPVGDMVSSSILVNAPFLLSLSREGLIENPWNEFLIQEIAKANFDYMKGLFQQQYFTALRVLAPNSLAGVSDRLRGVFGTQMAECQKAAFLPPQEGKILLTIAKCKVDPTGFYKQLYQAKLKISGMEEFVHPDIDPQELLRRFPRIGQTILEEIISLLPALMNSNKSVDTWLLILRFFSQIFQSYKPYTPNQLEMFKKGRFVVTTRLDLISLEEVHLPLVTKYPIDLPACLPLNVIHPDLLKPEIVVWLSQIGVMPLTPDKIVNYFQRNLNDPTLITRETNIQIIRLLFTLFSQADINESNVRTLQGIPLLTNAGNFPRSTYVYLSGIFKPKFSLEEYLPNETALFVSADYRRNEDNLQIWKKFFLALGVYETCEMTFQHNMTVRSLRGIPCGFIEEYLKYVFSGKEEHLPAKRPAQDKDDIITFAYFPYVAGIRYSDSFGHYFWKQLLGSTDKILKSFAETTYHAANAKTKKQPITYLQYVFQHQELIPDKGGVYHCSRELYAPSMEPVLREYFRPGVLAVLPVTLSREMEQFLGFKMRIDVNDCHALLGILKKPGNYRPEAYKLVLEHLLLNSRIPEEREKIKQIAWCFQATDNTWPTLDKLHYLSNTRSSLPIDSPNWIKPVLSEREMEDFCAFFGIKPGQKKQNLKNLESAQACDELKEFIQEKISEIAFRWALHRNNDKSPEWYVGFLLLTINQLEFYLFEEEDETPEEFESFVVDNYFYYYAEWERNLESIATTLSEHLKFVGPEATLLRDAIKARKPRHVGNEKLFESFKNAYEAKKKEAAVAEIMIPTPPLALLQNILVEDSGFSEAIPLTKHSAVSPKGARRSIENDLDALVHQEGPSAAVPRTPQGQIKKTGNKGPWIPKTTPDKVNESPDKKEPASKPALVTKSETGKGVSFANKTKSRVEKTPGRSEIDNKRLGLWAEKHVLFKRIKKCMDKLKEFDPKEEKPAPGITRITCVQKATTIDFLWYNSPERRPVEYKDDDSWDSCQHYDIQMTKTTNGVITKTRMIEVKGTEEDKIHFFLGALEWQTLLDNPDKYRIRVVTNVGLDNAEVTPIKNLIESLKKKKYVPCSSIEFRE